MKKIEIKKLEIENFKGCKSLSIDFSHETNIFGKNASGKTTIFDAFTWLMFDKDSTGATKFNIRPVDADGKDIDNIEISVYAELDIDGTGISLKKTQKQNWVKKRGSETAVLQGNKNEYEVNTFPVSEKEYKEYVSNIVEEDTFRIITDANAFASLPWKKQREQLLRIVSDVSDAEVIQLNKGFESIVDDLSMAPIDKCVEKAKISLRKLKEEQKSLPVRIDELCKMIVSDVPDKKTLENEKKELSNKAEALKQKLMEAYNNDADDKKQAAINAKRELVSYIQTKEAEALKTYSEIKTAYEKAMAEGNMLFEKKVGIANGIKMLNEYKEREVKSKDEKAKQWVQTVNEALAPESTICPTCNRELPEDKVEEIKVNFENKKKARLDRIGKEGHEIAKTIQEITKKIDDSMTELEEVKDEWSKKATEASKLYEKLQSTPEKADFSADQEYERLEKAFANADKEASAVKESNEKEVLMREQDALNREISEIERQIHSIDGIIDNNGKLNERIEKLKEEQKEIGAKALFEEKKLYLLEEFSRCKMELLSKKINDKFRFSGFKLFENQINGGMKECCEMTINGVPYSSANSAAKIQSGLDVINTLQEVYEIVAPIFIDNRESVTRIPETKSQVINLFVSPEDKVLRIENK